MMKLSLSKILKLAVIISLIVFVIERFLFNNGFNLPLNELLKVYAIHFMYAATLTIVNVYFFTFIKQQFGNTYTANRVAIGAVGSILLTMLGLAVLRFITLVIIFNKSFQDFINDPYAKSYYVFGLIITLFFSLIFHVFYFYKAISDKKVKEQQIVAKHEMAKYESLKSQIDPHFLFNSLNVLTSLISEDPAKAENFTAKLSKVYRYVLEQKNKDLIELEEELNFAKTYIELLKMRFEDAIIFELPEHNKEKDFKILPLALQILLENSIKHNVISAEQPLHIKIEVLEGYLVVTNNFNPKSTLSQGTKVGLKNIKDRYELLTLKKVQIIKDDLNFIIKIPLLTKKVKHMKTTVSNDSYIRAVEQVEEIKAFYSGMVAYLIVIPFLIFINLKYVPQFHWFWFPMLGWGIGMVFQGFKAFSYNRILGKRWEERKIKEFMQNDQKQYWE
ncbi:MAG: 2TM domain-containing protein [Lutibacter sp.]